jgi:hypothetical protein
MAAENPLLSLFKEQLENQCKGISKQHALDQRGHWLIWWYFLELENFTPAEILDVACDSGGDLGIDAIWIDNNEVVHIYAFKNPEEIEREFPGSGVDAVISGLELIFTRKNDFVANEELLSRVEAIYQTIPTAYRLHIVTSGTGLGREATEKLNAFVGRIPSPSDEFFRWSLEDIAALQARFYQQNLPAVTDPIVFDIPTGPYIVKAGSAACFLFTVKASILADLYGRFGEGLLERNIRADQGSTTTNRAIEASCTGAGSDNFIHFNNGVSFLCDLAPWDPFKNQLTLINTQVVNGGQTVRVLSRAQQSGSLKDNVLVAVRVIASEGDKQFASDVTVNQNNQNQMKTGFLRSNDPCVMQLSNSLASNGWYLERRAGELKSATPDERSRIEHRIGRGLTGRLIKLKEGTQAYVGTFFRHPEMAKKNPKKMFQSVDDGGSFEKIFSSELTAEKFIIAVSVMDKVDDFVKQFMAKKQRKTKLGESEAWKSDYKELLGEGLVDDHQKILDQAIPQSAVFLCATIFQEWADILAKDPAQLPEHLKVNGRAVIQQHLRWIFDFARDNPDTFEKSWPSMMKSNTFVGKVVSYIRGIHAKHVVPRPHTAPSQATSRVARK